MGGRVGLSGARERPERRWQRLDCVLQATARANLPTTTTANTASPLRHTPQKTASHFADLKRRYADPVIALNLLKSKERR